MNNFCIAGFGEVMLRLCPPGVKRFAQALPGFHICLQAQQGKWHLR